MNDFYLESYLARWNAELQVPLLEWHLSLTEAKLGQTEIDALFGEIEQQMQSSKTALSKGISAATKAASVVSKALPPNLVDKLHDLIKDSKPIKAFDDLFERKKQAVLAKYPRFEKIVDLMGDKARRHPIMGAAVIGILTTAAALISGGVGGFAVASVLKTANELLKGETASKSLMRGGVAGLLGAIAAMPIRALGSWLTTFEITSETVPGYVNLVKVTMIHETNGQIDLNIDTYMSPDMHHKITTLSDIANEAISDGNYDRAADIYKKIGNVVNDTRYIESMDEVVANNEMLIRKARDGADNAYKTFNAIASALQGAATGVASKKLNEADIKQIAGNIAKWAKDRAAASGKEMLQNVTVKKLIVAWDKAGRPTDSNVLFDILKSAGVPESVLKQAYLSNNIKPPKAPAKTKQSKPKPIKVSTGDAAFDTMINDMIATQGKAAAVQYLTDLKNKAQTPSQGKTVHGSVRRASDGQDYKLDIGKTGDRIWINTKTGIEASDVIDAELEGASNAQGSTP